MYIGGIIKKMAYVRINNIRINTYIYIKVHSNGNYKWLLIIMIRNGNKKF